MSPSCDGFSHLLWISETPEGFDLYDKAAKFCFYWFLTISIRLGLRSRKSSCGPLVLPLPATYPTWHALPSMNTPVSLKFSAEIKTAISQSGFLKEHFCILGNKLISWVSFIQSLLPMKKLEFSTLFFCIDETNQLHNVLLVSFRGAGMNRIIMFPILIRCAWYQY